MKQKILLVVLFALNACFIFADPAPRDSFMITQPDGTMLWIYERGDEY